VGGKVIVTGPARQAGAAFASWMAAALLGFEYLALSLLFDAQPLALRSDGWVIAGHLGSLAALMVVAVTAAVLVGGYAGTGASGGGAWRVLLAARPLAGRSWLLLGGHAALFSALLLLSAAVFGPGGPPAGPAAAWLLLWVACAAGSAAFALAAAFPADRWGPLLRTLPLLLTGAAVGVGAWLAGQGSSLLWQPLAPFTLGASQQLLGLLEPEVVFLPERTLIGTPRFQVTMAPECSGFEGIGLMVVFLSAYLLLARRQLRFPAALWLLPVGLVAIWIGNVARIVGLIWVGSHLSESIAVSGFHAKAGWLLFCGLSLALVGLARRSRAFATTQVGPAADPVTAAHVLPFVTLLAVSFVTGLWTAQVDLLYGARILMTLAVLVAYRAHHGIGVDQARALTVRAVAPAAGLGLLAALLFVWLTPRPALEAVTAWRDQWSALPAPLRLAWIAMRVFGSVIIVPLAEELAFRGYLLRRLMGRAFEEVPPGRFSLPALLLSSAAFGAVHSGWVAGAVAGLLFGLAQVFGRSTLAAVLAHLVANVVVALAVLAFGQWWLWI
jgi:exosortase E/protease (VPEID-CTERM system)